MTSLNITPKGIENYLHNLTACEGEWCVIHNPSDHRMKDWPINIRTESALAERICPHGVGHPDPDSLAWIARAFGQEYANAYGVHGCDGCCLR